MIGVCQNGGEGPTELSKLRAPVKVRKFFESGNMASKFLCDCGYTVCTNSFEGHGIFRLISDVKVDAMKDPISVREVTDLWFASPELIACKGCGSFYQWDSDLKAYMQYKRVPVPAVRQDT